MSEEQQVGQCSRSKVGGVAGDDTRKVAVGQMTWSLVGCIKTRWLGVVGAREVADVF